MEYIFSFFNRPIRNVKPSRSVTLVEVYKLIIDLVYKLSTKRYRVASSQVKEKLKSEEFDYVTFSGVFERRSDANLIKHSGLLALDFDNLVDVESVKSKLINDPNIVTGLLFRSPSGNGIKWVIPIDLDHASHKEWFIAVSRYVKAKYQVEIDQSGKDVSRACFLCHDPDAYLNPIFENDPEMLVSQTLNLQEWLDTGILDNNGVITGQIQMHTKDYDKELYDQVDQEISKLEGNGVDITQRYSVWRDLGFSFVDGFGEDGRRFYHRISRFYPEYSIDDCNEQYDKCLTSGKSGITIGTFFHYAKNALNGRSDNVEDKGDSDGNLPNFPSEIYNELPYFIQRITQVGKNAEEKDVLLLGTLTTLSSSLPNISGVYDGNQVFANLFFLLIGKAGSGKSILNHCRALVMPIQKDLALSYENDKKKFKRENALFRTESRNDNTIEAPDPPKRKLMIIPANSSAAGVYELLNDNGGRGLIFETEGDTLANTFGNKEWGDFSDGFRKAFHHETISSYRKTKSELIEVLSPQLSVVLSGTPMQLHHLISDAENGLFSRFMYYYLPMRLTWKDVFSEFSGGSLQKQFESLGNEFYEFYKSLISGGTIHFSLTKSQSEFLNDHFSSLQLRHEFLQGDTFVSAVRRLGLICFRIAMILSALRVLEDDVKPSQIVCNDLDFKTSIQIVETLLNHSIFIYDGLDKATAIKRVPNVRDKFYRSLPSEFSWKDYLESANKLGLNPKTVEAWLKKFKDKGMIFHIAHNHYQKAA